MPRPNKPVELGSLTDPITASRPSTWRKHAGPESADEYEPDGAILVDALTHETVEEIDLTPVDTPLVTIAPTAGGFAREPAPVAVPREWTSGRAIEGRAYRRVDELAPVSS